MRTSQIRRIPVPNPDPFQPLLDIGMHENTAPRARANTRTFWNGRRYWIVTNIDYDKNYCSVKPFLGAADRGLIKGTIPQVVRHIHRVESKRSSLATMCMDALRNPSVIHLVRFLEDQLGRRAQHGSAMNEFVSCSGSTQTEGVLIRTMVVLSITKHREYAALFEFRVVDSVQTYRVRMVKPTLEDLCKRCEQIMSTWATKPLHLIQVLQSRTNPAHRYRNRAINIQ